MYGCLKCLSFSLERTRLKLDLKMLLFYRYINNSLRLVRKYARIFVRGDYLFGEANCELRGTDDIVSRTNILAYFRPK